jgi:hypothetical protein
MELKPRLDTPGYYVHARAPRQARQRQGAPRERAASTDGGARQVLLERRTGKLNLAGFNWKPGGKVVTHAVTLSSDGKFRSDWQFDRAAAQRLGKYEHWDAQDWKADTPLLEEYARQWVRAYKGPPQFYEVKLQPDGSPNLYYYLLDFIVGDVIRARRRVGHGSNAWLLTVDGRITEWRLRQPSKSTFQQEIDVIPEAVGELETEDSS